MARSRAWPVVTLLLLAPLLGESLSSATPPLSVVTWGLVTLVPLYGCGALLCRELARRHRAGLVFLAAAYAVYEEALVDGYWFDTSYAAKVGVGDYTRVWHTSLLLATHLTAFHVVVSVVGSIVLVERLFSRHGGEPWLPGRWLVVPGLAFAAVVPMTWDSYERGPLGPVIASAGLFALLVVAAFTVPRVAFPGRSRPRLAGVLAAGCTAGHFALVYTVPHLGLPWPVGLVVALAPVALGAGLVPRLSGGSALPGVTGVLTVCAGISGLVGLGGRYDLTVFALVLTAVLWRLNRADQARRAVTPL